MVRNTPLSPGFEWLSSRVWTENKGPDVVAAASRFSMIVLPH
jgi:hypothetical protein